MATISGAEALARTLVRLGTDVVFNIAGFGLQPLAEALDRHRDDFLYVSALNETNVALIANGYAHATGRPAFLNVYHASGTALAMIAVTTAWADQAPLVMTSTTGSRLVSGRDSYAAIPRRITDMSAQFTKWDFEIPSADRIPEVLARAFAIAQTPPMGPVHVSIPMDLYNDTVDESILDSLRPLAIPIPGGPDGDALRRAVAELAASRDPVLVLGAEVARYGAIDEAVELAEALGASVLIEPFPSRMPFPTTHEQYLGKVQDFPEIVTDADVVLYFGSELTEQRQSAQSLLRPTGATRIFASVDPQLTTKFFTPDIALTGMPGPVLAALAAGVRSEAEPHGRPARFVERRRRARDRRQVLLDDGFDSVPLRAGRIIHELATASSEAVILNQAGTSEVFAQLLWDFEQPQRYFGVSAKASAQGWIVPAAVGVSLAKPGRPVIAFVGDGGFMFSATGIHAAAHLGAHVVYVVVDNGGWRDIAASSRVIGGESHLRESELGWKFDSPTIDFVGLAQSLGVPATRASTPEDLREQLRIALEAEGPRVVVVDADPADVEFFFRA